MIESFKDKRAEAIFKGRQPGKGFPADLIRVARRKLIMLAEARTLEDLRSPPSNHLEALKKDRAGQHSIRIKISGGSASFGPAMIRRMWRSSTITRTGQVGQVGQVNKNPLAPVHPGEMLREEFLAPLGMTAYALAAELHVPRTRIERLVREETPVTPDTAVRLARYFGTTPEFWLGIQNRFDVETARKLLGDDIAAIKPRKTA